MCIIICMHNMYLAVGFSLCIGGSENNEVDRENMTRTQILFIILLYSIYYM